MEQKVNLELTVNQLNVIINGLIKLPIEVGLETFNVVQQQVQQLNASANPEGPLSDKIVK